MACRRTSRPLIAIVDYVKSLKGLHFDFPIRKAFKWWWAFCKKHSIISLYYREKNQNLNVPVFLSEEQPGNYLQPIQTSPQNLSSRIWDVFLCVGMQFHLFVLFVLFCLHKLVFKIYRSCCVLFMYFVLNFNLKYELMFGYVNMRKKPYSNHLEWFGELSQNYSK